MSVRILVAALLLSFGVEAKVPLEKMHLATSCSIYSMTGVNIKNLPGHMCLYLDDGRFVSFNEASLKMYDRLGAVAWEIKGHFHHQINFSLDKKHILALGSEEVTESDGKFRYDKFYVISLAGEIVQEVNVAKFIKEHKLATRTTRFMQEDARRLWGYQQEKTHFNSIYEIPPVSKQAPVFLQDGGYIVNSMYFGLMVISKDFQTMKFFKKLDIAWWQMIHDVQIQPNGRALLFNNNVMQGKPDANNKLYSAVQEIDLVSGKVLFEFTANPKQFFYSAICGGVQDLDGDILVIAGNIGGTYVYSRKKQEVLYYVRSTHAVENFRPVQRQQTKALDLSSFLANSL